jgi:hypothetical protein
MSTAGIRRISTLSRPQPVRKVAGPFTHQHWPLLVAVAVLLLTVLALLAASLHRTQGHLIYVLDDTYIHMAMAKNFAEHGVWGVTQDGFTSTSSGPLWTLLLAGVYALTGVNAVSPFVMNLVSACLVLLIAYVILRAHGLPPHTILFALLAVTLLTPLPALIFVGMEHTLQTALTLAAAFLAARVLSSTEPDAEQRSYYWLLGLAPLLTSVRFEGMFLVVVIALGFFLRRQARRGVLFAASGLLPVAVYGAISNLHGWPWLPTSVLLKSGFSLDSPPEVLLTRFMDQVVGNVWAGRHLVGLVLLAGLLDGAGRRAGEWARNPERIMSGIFIGAGILHVGFARVGWFYRYEAYLMALGVLVVACRLGLLLTALVEPAAPNSHPHALPEVAAVFVLVMALFFGLVRGSVALRDIPQAAANEFEQQYQMAAFIKRYYQRSAVALNDIGAVNYLADIHCLDLLGLGTLEVARRQMRGDYGREEIAKLAMDMGARIAIIHDLYFSNIGGIPPEWIRVGQWQIRNRVLGGSDTVSIYAIDPSEAGALMAHLAEFSRVLPGSVVQRGLYTQQTGCEP